MLKKKKNTVFEIWRTRLKQNSFSEGNMRNNEKLRDRNEKGAGAPVYK